METHYLYNELIILPEAPTKREFIDSESEKKRQKEDFVFFAL